MGIWKLPVALQEVGLTALQRDLAPGNKERQRSRGELQRVATPQTQVGLGPGGDGAQVFHTEDLGRGPGDRPEGGTVVQAGAHGVSGPLAEGAGEVG